MEEVALIKINLCPPKELEIRFWYAADLATFALVSVILYSCVYIYFDQVQKHIDFLDAERLEFVKNTANLGPDIERYSEIDKKISILHKKIEALKKITVSKLAKYRPVILLEHLQNLRSEGLWFHRIVDESDHQILRLAGAAFDHLSIAEFLGSMHATQFQAVDPALLRTQIYFSEGFLVKVVATDHDLSHKSSQNLLSQPTKIEVLDPLLKQSIDSQKVSTFPGLKGPSWQINVRYNERHVKNEMTNPSFKKSKETS